MRYRLVCVDTSFLVALEHRDEKALEKLQELQKSNETIHITAISVAEYYRGAYTVRDRIRALRDARGLLGRFAVLDLDYEAGRIWGELAHLLKSKIIGDRDLFIASIALANRQIFITRNKKHFEHVPGLQVEEW